jgi:hypothetical protein
MKKNLLQKACFRLRHRLNLKTTLAFLMCLGVLQVVVPNNSFSQNYQQIALTGFNHDLVANGSNVVASASTSTAMDRQGTVMYVRGYQGCIGYLQYGLPQNGAITSAFNGALTYQMAPFTQNNALFLTSGNSGTLNFGTSGSYDLISILANQFRRIFEL